MSIDFEQLSKHWGSFPVDTSGARCSLAFRGARNNAASTSTASLPNKPDASTATVHKIFLSGLKISKDGSCLGRRVDQRFDFLTYEQMDDKINKLAQALAIRTGLKKQDCIGLYSANCPEWCITAMASASASFVLVPLYDTLGAEACADIITEVEMKIMFVDTYAAAQRILHKVEATLPPSLKTIVVFFNPGDDVEMNAGQSRGIRIVRLDEFLKLPTDNDGHPLRAVIESPAPDDLYMVQYTSGTTGRPKGVMLTHSNFTANIAGVIDMYRRPDSSLTLGDRPIVVLHYLPLAHSYGQVLLLTAFYIGGSVGFYGGNIQKLLEDACILRPNWLPLVPRLMNKFYAKVHAELQRKGGIAAKLFAIAYARKRDLLIKHSICTRRSIWDYLVFRKLQAKLGGQVEFMLTTSAPVSPEVLEFWRVCFGVMLIEGYGQTEATALVTASMSPQGGNVGHPVSCNIVKLVDVEELGYLAREDKGEICIKGENVMKGYYKQPDRTAETIDADGWLHTGDVGEFAPSTGALRIIDRKKHIFKLAQGEYIAPEKIESVYASCPLIAQVYVDGNSLQWFTVAVVVPDAADAREWAEAHGLSGKETELPALCKSDDFRRHVQTTLLELGKAKGLNQLEQVRAIYLHSDLFSVANNLLTPSLKNRRPQLRAYFREQIDHMYATNQAEQKTTTTK